MISNASGKMQPRRERANSVKRERMRKSGGQDPRQNGRQQSVVWFGQSAGNSLGIHTYIYTY